MAVSLKHAFTSNVADSPDATLVQPSNWNAEHTLTANANSILGTVTAGAVVEITCTSAGRDLLDDADASAQRTTLGLGTIATQNSNNVSITGGSISGASVSATSVTSSGVVTVTSGSNSAPSIVPSGDTNTGFFFPTADTVAISTGGSERLRVNSSGQVGVNVSPTAELDLNGNYAANVVAVSALDVDCSTGNYFTKTISADSTFTFSNAPASRSFSFTLELTQTSGAVTWPASVKWPSDTAPTLTTGKTHLFIFVTDDGGTRWRGASLVDYTN